MLPGAAEGGAMQPRQKRLRIAASIFAFMFASLCAHAQGDNPSKDAKRKGPKNAAPPPDMNCEQMSASSRGAITVEACKQMMAAQHAYTAAASDSSASRPGDDEMTCDQIAAEIKQQPLTSPDKATVAEAQAATDDFKTTAEKQQKEATELAVKETAEESLLSRLAPTNAVAAAESKRIEEEQKKQNERMTKEQAPKAERMFNSFGDLTGDLGKQIAANPRLARLYQLATQKRCTAAQLK
jgi:hypothetical protein